MNQSQLSILGCALLDTARIWVGADGFATRSVPRLMASRFPLGPGVAALSSVVEATDSLITYTPVLAICDLRSPFSAIVDLLSQIRNILTPTDLPVITCIDTGDRKTRLAAIEAGVTDFLTNPVECWELQHRSLVLVDFYRQTHELAQLRRWNVITNNESIVSASPYSDEPVSEVHY
jgi:DNA-binding response OmpR family regulator